MSIDTFLLSADTTDLNYPEVRPTLDLNFARVKALDPRITFTRASGGSYVGADGLIKYAGVNEARFDHDPVTGESLGLLVEEARTNLITNNNTYTVTSNANITIDNSITSPDGTTGVQKVTSNITGGTFYSASNNITNSTGFAQNYTWSVFVKKGNPLTRSISFQFGITNTAALVYNFDTDTITNVTAVSFGRTLYPNGWVRLHGMTSIPNGSIFNLIVIVKSAEIYGGINANFYQWGAQVEAGSFPTSYIPTQASTRTRAADNASITGKNFSEWYRQDEGTIYCSFYRSLEPSTFHYPVGVRNQSDFNNRIHILFSTAFNGIIRGGIIKDGVTQVDSFTAAVYSRTSINKSIISYEENNVTAAASGSLGGTNTTAQIPQNINQMVVGAIGPTGQLNGHISHLTYYPKRLPNQQLQALTR
jgi:hypothetical protein